RPSEQEPDRALDEARPRHEASLLGAGAGGREGAALVPVVTPIDRSCRRLIVIGLAVVMTAFALSLAAWRAPGTSAAFLSLAAATWLVVSRTLWRARRLLDPRATRLGAATHLTLLRGLLVSVAVGFVPVAPVGALRWFLALFYGAAALCDRF